MDIDDTEACYRAVKSRDRRFDGVFYTGVTSTGIYCRPSCPAITPAKRNVTFHRTAAAAQAAGFRACKRCLPDATPGSPDWDVAADTAGRAMRLIADGVVERDGVEGLAARVGYTARHLHRLLTSELGAGPLALARARRAQNARILIETTAMPFADVAFAAGFASIRQFNDTIREVYAGDADRPPRPVAARRRDDRPHRPAAAGARAVRRERAAALPGRPPRAGRGGQRPGLVRPDPRPAARPRPRPADLPARRPGHGHGLRALRARPSRTCATSAPPSSGADGCWTPTATRSRWRTGCRTTRGWRRWCGSVPGSGCPGSVDGDEIAIRAVVGQQISLAGAHLAGRQARRAVRRDRRRQPVVRRTAPAVPAGPGARRGRPRGPADAAGPGPRAGRPVPRRWPTGTCRSTASTDRAEVRARLLALPGIGPWTADYVAMRALGDPDVFLPTDVGVRTRPRRPRRRPRPRPRRSPSAGGPGAPTA